MTNQGATIPTSSLATPQDWAKDYKTPSDIEKPLASGRNTPEDSGLPVNKSSNSNKTPAQFVMERQQQYARQRQILDKYHSIDSLNRTDKAEALKDPKLNPYLLNNPYDGLAASLNKWKSVASKVSSGKYDDKTKQTIASNYYNKMIAPMYGGMKISPMEKDVWMKQAYKEALNYNVEDSYNRSFVNSIKQVNTGYAATDRAFSYVTDMLGNVLDDSVALWKKAAAERAKPDSERAKDLSKPWFQQAKDLHNFISTVPHEGKLRDISNNFLKQSNKEDFWAQALPTHDGWYNHATSFIAEQAGQLPVYVAMGLGEEAAGVNLTKNLFKSGLGKKDFSYLMAGTEGLAYGTATRKQEDKSQAWKDAVGFAVFHGLFDVAGSGTKKLIDVARDSGNKDLLEKLEHKEETLNLAQEGKRRATPAEIYEDHKNGISNNLSVAGITGQRSIFKDALQHVQDVSSKNWSRDQIRKYEHSSLNEDPARWAPTFSAAKFIRSLIGDKRVEDLSGKETVLLSNRINKLISDSAVKMNTHSVGMKEQLAKDTEEKVKTPTSKKALDFYRAKAASQVAKENPTALKMMKPEELDKLASTLMAKDAEKAASHSEKELTRDGPKEATNIAKRRKVSAGLPDDIKGSKPRYGYQNKNFELNFEDPRDLAAYTVTQTTKNKAHDKFMSYLMQHFDSAAEAQAHGRKVRDSIKDQAKDADPKEGALYVTKQFDDSPKIKFKSSYKEDKFGQASASFNASPDTKAYFKNYAKQAKDNGQTLSEFFEDMSDEDFTKDLSDHFYPRALRDANIYFEHQNTTEGKQDPNFLAFMYNYTHEMPKEFGKELENRLINTMKVQKYMNGKTPTEPQLEYYAHSMYNHVDNFLGSGRWPQESNIFRTSNKDMFNSTRWQMQLLREKMTQEKKNIKDMFSSNPKAQRAALTAHQILSKKRLEEYTIGPSDLKSQERVKDIDTDISDVITQTGDYERIPF